MGSLTADPVLRGLEDRSPGSPCNGRCELADCEMTCHERHHATTVHDQYYCDQIRLGRDVSEYRPEIRQEWSDFLATLPAVRIPADRAAREQAIAIHAEDLRRARNARR